MSVGDLCGRIITKIEVNNNAPAPPESYLITRFDDMRPATIWKTIPNGIVIQ